ncbi:MAG: acyl-ACP--UDP-N-acetylglucosamine O-acyltransferase [Planctomycetes bacterium]|nr:acyl-ACP--UDP-N-acetylglucosamine O-acyltransferase [Planctomycetota bacterium]
MPNRTQGREAIVTQIIHPTAVVHSRAQLGNNICVGPFCVLEADTVLGDDCVLLGRVTIKAGTYLDADNEVGEGTVLGGKPQHAKVGSRYGGLRIGRGNRFRENVTVHCAFEPDRVTRIGDENLLMVNAHVAHDCTIGSRTIIVNNVMIGGHASVEDRAYLGGGAGVHQFCRVGELAMVGAQAHIVQDVAPYLMIDGATSRVVGLNRVGLRRNGFTEDQLVQLKAAYKIMYRSGMTWTEVVEELKSQFNTGAAARYATFIQSGKRGFVPERRLPRRATIKIPSSDDRSFIDDQLRRFG